MNDIDNLAHTKWRCQYHIVFAPKYSKLRQAIARTLEGYEQNVNKI